MPGPSPYKLWPPISPNQAGEGAVAPSYSMMASTNGAGPRRVLRPAAAVATLIAASAIAVAPAAAQARAGGHGLYQNKLVSGSYGYGGRVEFDLDFLVEELVIGGSYDRVFPGCDECSYTEAGANVGFYAGIGHLAVGLSFSRLESAEAGAQPTIEDDWIWSLVGGVRYPLNRFVTPFFEIRNEMGEGILNSQTLALGILLGPNDRQVGAGTSGRRTR